VCVCESFPDAKSNSILNIINGKSHFKFCQKFLPNKKLDIETQIQTWNITMKDG